MLQHSPRASSQENLFGVRVQVQGIKGQPYVVLNTSGQESHKDVSVITHQAGYKPGMVRRSADETQRRPNSSGFNYQSQSEILRPYAPENNIHNHSRSHHTSLSTETMKTTKPRIPLPAEGPAEDPAEFNHNPTCPSEGHSAPLYPSSVDTDSIMSVGRLISQFNSSLQRGRGPRNRLDPEACRRSRSVDSSRTSSSSSSSPLSSIASSLKGTRGDTPAGIYPPGSARARLLGGESAWTNSGEESKLSKGQQGKETVTLSHRAEKPPVSRQAVDQTAKSDERDAQMKTERERARAEMKDLQQQLSEMHDELDKAKKTDVINTEKEVLLRVEEERGTAKVQLKELVQERDNLKGKARELSNKVEQLNQVIQEFKTTERMMEQRTKQLEREKNQVEEMLEDVRRSEEELCQSNQSLLSRLEDVQMNTIMEECEASTDVLQNQVDEARERSQRELTELRRQLQEKGGELEKSRQAAKKLQEEVWPSLSKIHLNVLLLPLEEDLRRCRREQQEAQLRGRQLEQRVEELEEKNAAGLEERERQTKLMEVYST
ncbi:hypothetical protein GOODEAATRI_016727 [Goodea atripinnis]|uniref:Cingulin-like protein 1 n=1 Tax=Goodea atripinnis TaxID=208336 RepID=A0ABV0PPH7_9TELE